MAKEEERNTQSWAKWFRALLGYNVREENEEAEHSYANEDVDMLLYYTAAEEEGIAQPAILELYQRYLRNDRDSRIAIERLLENENNHAINLLTELSNEDKWAEALLLSFDINTEILPIATLVEYAEKEEQADDYGRELFVYERRNAIIELCRRAIVGDQEAISIVEAKCCAEEDIASRFQAQLVDCALDKEHPKNGWARGLLSSSEYLSVKRLVDYAEGNSAFAYNAAKELFALALSKDSAAERVITKELVDEFGSETVKNTVVHYAAQGDPFALKLLFDYAEKAVTGYVNNGSLWVKGRLARCANKNDSVRKQIILQARAHKTWAVQVLLDCALSKQDWAAEEICSVVPNVRIPEEVQSNYLSGLVKPDSNNYKGRAIYNEKVTYINKGLIPTERILSELKGEEDHVISVENLIISSFAENHGYGALWDQAHDTYTALGKLFDEQPEQRVAFDAKEEQQVAREPTVEVPEPPQEGSAPEIPAGAPAVPVGGPGF